MARHIDPVEEELLFDYLDGNLDPDRRAEVVAYLQRNPKEAAKVSALRLQDEALRSLGGDVLAEPVPDRLRDILYRQPSGRDAGRAPVAGPSRRRTVLGPWVNIAAALFIFVLGSLVGWFGRSGLEDTKSDLQAFLGESASGFAYYTGGESFIPEFPPEQDDRLTAALKRLFNRSIPRPDFADQGFKYVGARVSPGMQRRAGFFFYEGADGTRISVVVWPNDGPANRTPLAGRFNDVSARFWTEQGFGFAVMGSGDQLPLDGFTKTAVSYYQSELGTPQ